MYSEKFENEQGKCQIRNFCRCEKGSSSYRSQFFKNKYFLKAMNGMRHFNHIYVKDQEQLYYVGVLIEDLRSDQVATRISAMKQLCEIGTI